ncbi:hypothetical protein MXB_1260, partial [Myxobolus squamalis]
ASNSQFQGFGFTPLVTTAPVTAVGLSSVWNSFPTNVAPAPAPVPVQPMPPVMYPTSHVGAYQPPYPPQPSFYMPPRYYPYGDPYMYMRPPAPQFQPDPFSYLYREYDSHDPMKETKNIQKILLQKHEAQALWYKYGIDPSVPISNNFLAKEDEKDFVSRRRFRDSSIDYNPKTISNDAIIHVVPKLAGIKNGKQQIVLNIEETPANQSYIPKIFNTNSEISFTITSRDTSANKSFMTSVLNDATDEAIPQNLLNRSPNTIPRTRDLPKPILNCRYSTKKKSILDMDLSDYQIVPKLDRHVVDDSNDARRVTFQDDVDALIEDTPRTETSRLQPYDTDITRKSSFLDISSLSKVTPEPAKIYFSSSEPNRISKPRGGRIGGTLTSFNDSSFVNTSIQTANDSRNSVSRFTWTPSWFISKLIGGFSSEHKEPVNQNKPSQIVSILPESHQSSGSKSGVVLTRDSYYSRPSVEELNDLTKDNHCYVKDFIVGRYNFGNILFHGETDIFQINIDKIVFIERFEVEVYKDDDSNKPPVGFGLNKPATITLLDVFPQSPDGSFIRTLNYDSLRDFEVYLKNKTDDLNAEFLSYFPETGSFSFKVQHFTKYGLSLSNIHNISQNPVDSRALNIHLVGSVKSDPVFLDPNISTNSTEISDLLVNEHELDVKPSGFHFSKIVSCLSGFNEILYCSKHFRIMGNSLQWVTPFKITSICNTDDTRKSQKVVFPVEISINNQKLKIRHLSTSQDNCFAFEQSIDNIEIFFNSFVSVLYFDCYDEKSIPQCRFGDPLPILDVYINNSFSSLDPPNISRTKHFSNWIKNTYQEVARRESVSHFSHGNVFSAALSLLSAHLLEETVSLLNSTNNHRLATILCASSSVCANQTVMAAQLDKWLFNGVYKHMDIGFIKICMLLAGVFVIELEPDLYIHVCEGFDWIRALGLFVSFPLTRENPLVDGFSFYKQHFKNYPSYVAGPYPLYNSSTAYDLKYYVLEYFCNSTINAPVFFETDTYTSNPLDYSLSYPLSRNIVRCHVYIILNMIKGLVFPIESTLFVNYSRQLEDMGYWSFAIFILLFMKSELLRTENARTILQRNIFLLDSQQAFLYSIKIPSYFINMCK